MKALYESIDRILTGDATMRSLVNFKQKINVPVGQEGYQAGESSMTIRRGFQTTGNWKKLLTYYLQADFVTQDFSPNIREVPLVLAIFDRTSDLNLFDVAERAIYLLDNADLSVSGKVHSYGCFYIGQIQAPHFDKELKSYMMTIRFRVQVHKLNKEC
jgi:hypothetical protein